MPPNAACAAQYRRVAISVAHPVMVAHDTIVLLWGLWCLRGAKDDVTAA
jgi:hypothetical protein